MDTDREKYLNEALLAIASWPVTHSYEQTLRTIQEYAARVSVRKHTGEPEQLELDLSEGEKDVSV